VLWLFVVGVLLLLSHLRVRTDRLLCQFRIILLIVINTMNAYTSRIIVFFLWRDAYEVSVRMPPTAACACAELFEPPADVRRVAKYQIKPPGTASPSMFDTRLSVERPSQEADRQVRLSVRPDFWWWSTAQRGCKAEHPGLRLVILQVHKSSAATHARRSRAAPPAQWKVPCVHIELLVAGVRR